jgi:ribonuclease HII
MIVMMCGVDEAGRGPVIGPLVVAGLSIDDDVKLKNIRVKDSKKLSPKRREYLKKKINELAHQTKLLIVPAADIDTMRKTMTLNEIEVYAFSKIIDTLKPQVCYVDAADVNDVRFGNDILKKLSYKPTIVSKHRADDRYPVVAAASILAKTTRDEYVSRIAQSLEQKLRLPLGSGYPADPHTQKFLTTWYKKYGELPPHVRHSWKTAHTILAKSKLKRLDEF